MIGSSKGQDISLLIEYDEEMVMKYTHYDFQNKGRRNYPINTFLRG